MDFGVKPKNRDTKRACVLHSNCKIYIFSWPITKFKG